MPASVTRGITGVRPLDLRRVNFGVKLSLGKHLAALASFDAFSFAEILPDEAIVLLRFDSIVPKLDRYVSRIGPYSEFRLFSAELSAAEYEGWPSQTQVERAW